jgi:hypothetical protein
MSFTFLGSDGVLKFRRPAGTGSARGKQGQITLQHGDIVGVQTGPEGLEVIAQQDGFGMCKSTASRVWQCTDNESLYRTSDIPSAQRQHRSRYLYIYRYIYPSSKTTHHQQTSSPTYQRFPRTPDILVHRPLPTRSRTTNESPTSTPNPSGRYLNANPPNPSRR